MVGHNVALRLSHSGVKLVKETLKMIFKNTVINVFAPVRKKKVPC